MKRARSSSGRGTFVAAPEWYVSAWGPPFLSYEDLIHAKLPRQAAELCTRIAPLRGAALAVLARRDAFALVKGVPGAEIALLLAALIHRGRRVVILEFIDRPPSERRCRRIVRSVWDRVAVRPAMRRAMALGHVLTGWEGSVYAERYGIEEERFRFIRWPLCRWGREAGKPVDRDGASVMASGRAHSDWETLFAASRGASWHLTVACAEADHDRVQRLNSGDAATVHVELSRAEHDELLRECDLYAMAMREVGASAGHVRLMAAVENGVPVVASEIKALDGYAASGETAVLVPAGRSAALRTAIDSLLGDPGRRERLRDTALERAREWSYDHYFEALRVAILPVVREE